MMMAWQMHPLGRGVGATCGRPGECGASPREFHPPFSFRSCRKENGPWTVQKKRTLRAEPARACRFAYIRGSSEYVPTKTGESSAGSRRTVPLRGSCAAIAGSAQTSGWLLKGLSFWIRFRFVWWWMGALFLAVGRLEFIRLNRLQKNMGVEGQAYACPSVRPTEGSAPASRKSWEARRSRVVSRE